MLLDKSCNVYPVANPKTEAHNIMLHTPVMGNCV